MHPKLSINVYWLFFIVLFISSQTTLAQGRNSISGIVFDTSRTPVPNIRLELLDEIGSRLTTTQSDNSGGYFFRNLSDGNFLIKPVTMGTQFANTTYRIQLFPAGGRGAHHEQLDITLKAVNESKIPTNLNADITFAQEVPEAARKEYERGVSILDSNGAIEEGLSALKSALSIFPTYYLALERFGTELVKSNNFEAAREPLNKAIEINPKSSKSYYVLGIAEYRLKRYQTSIEFLKKSISFNPSSPNAPFTNYYLGLALLRNGKNEEAITRLKKAYDTGDKKIPSDVHMALAQIYSTKKQYKEAINELELYLKETPDAKNTEQIQTLIKQMQEKSK